MKKKIYDMHTGRFFFLCNVVFGLAIFLSFSAARSFGQQNEIVQSINDVPKVISYQGMVNNTTGSAIPDGNYAVTASFYSDASGSSKLWQGIYTVNITRGIFNVMLGSGNSPLPEIKIMNKPIWVGIQVGDGPEMRPLTQLSSSPYSLNIPDNSVTKAKMGTDYIGKITINGQEIKGKGSELNLVTGDGIQMDFNPATNDVLLTASGAGKASPQTIMPPCPACNDAPNPASNFLGTGAYNVASGTPGIGFVTIPGGYNNNASGDMSAIVGGAGNVAAACGAFVGGGGVQLCPGVPPNLPPMPATIFQGNKAAGISSSIVGGIFNFTGADYSFLGGGQSNSIIQGVAGSLNWAFLGGGTGNLISTAGGGTSLAATLCGGQGNSIGVGGGPSDFAFIGGGAANIINSAGLGSSIVGGMNNSINAPSFASIVCGGQGNNVNAPMSGIVSGVANSVTPGGPNSFIGSGNGNFANAGNSTITGGGLNRTNGMFSSIPGGLQAQTRDWGQMAHASGSFATPGDAQTSVFILRNQTPAGAGGPTSLFLDGAGTKITVPPNGAMTFHANIVGKSAGTCANTWGYQISGTITECGGVTNIVGINLTNVFNNPFGATIVAIGNATSNLDIQITTFAGTPVVDWVATVYTSEVVF